MGWRGVCWRLQQLFILAGHHNLVQLLKVLSQFIWVCTVYTHEHFSHVFLVSFYEFARILVLQLVTSQGSYLVGWQIFREISLVRWEFFRGLLCRMANLQGVSSVGW